MSKIILWIIVMTFLFVVLLGPQFWWFPIGSLATLWALDALKA